MIEKYELKNKWYQLFNFSDTKQLINKG